MKSTKIVVLMLFSVLVLISMLHNVSACEINRKGDCCYQGNQKCCMVRDNGRTVCYGNNGINYRIKEYLFI